MLSAKMYRSRATLAARDAVVKAVKNGSDVETAKIEYKDALTKEIDGHATKTIPIFQTETINGESLNGELYMMANYFAVPAQWTNGAYPNSFVLYAYFDNQTPGTFDPCTYALGVLVNYTTTTGAEDILVGQSIFDVQLTSSGFGAINDGLSSGLLVTANNNEDGIIAFAEIQLITLAIGIDQSKYAVFYSNQTSTLFDLSYNGSITQLIGTQHVFLTLNSAPSTNVNTLTFVDNFNDYNYFWLWILFLTVFLLLMVIYFDEWFPTPKKVNN